MYNSVSQRFKNILLIIQIATIQQKIIVWTIMITIKLEESFLSDYVMEVSKRLIKINLDKFLI